MKSKILFISLIIFWGLLLILFFRDNNSEITQVPESQEHIQSNTAFLQPQEYNDLYEFFSHFSQMLWDVLNPIEEKFLIVVTSWENKYNYKIVDFQTDRYSVWTQEEKNKLITEIIDAYKSDNIYDEELKRYQISQ